MLVFFATKETRRCRVTSVGWSVISWESGKTLVFLLLSPSLVHTHTLQCDAKQENTWGIVQYRGKDGARKEEAGGLGARSTRSDTESRHFATYGTERRKEKKEAGRDMTPRCLFFLSHVFSSSSCFICVGPFLPCSP